MSYQSRETSVAAGEPIELYRFVLGTTRWTYTSAKSEVVYQSETYAPVFIRRNDIGQTREINRQALSIEVTRDNALAAQFLAAPPDGTLTLTLYRFHQSDAETIVFWKGRVIAARWSGSLCELKGEPVFSSLKRGGLRAHYQPNCRHVLYDSGCKANNELFKVTGTASTISGLNVTVAALAGQPDGWAVGGYLVTGEAGYRMITAHTGTTVTLTAPILGLLPGAAVFVFAGCDHTLAICDSKFSNSANYGGFPYIPKKNPFSGDAII